jgi:hypothetical protein
MKARGMVAVLALVGVVALAGCGGDDGPKTLEELLGWGGAGEEARLQARLRQTESLIADCMAREGFVYRPVEFPVSGGVVAAPDAEIPRAEYVRRYGFGMTRWLDEPEEMAEPPAEWEDPNAEILAGLSDAERTAYLTALHGHAPVTDGPDGSLDYVPAAPGGCSAEAHQVVYGAAEKVWQELSDEFDALNQRIESDPRIAESMTAWSSCMRAAGYDFANKHEPFNYLDRKLTDEVYIDLPDESVVHVGADTGWVPPQVDRAALEAFRAEEIAIATADHECDTQADLEGVRARVTEDHESRFIARYRDQLEILRGDS